MTLRALSVRQPWAWCIVHGHKPVENRSWRTNYRGPLLIHAGQRFDVDGYRWIQAHFPDLLMPPRDAFDRGGFVGCAELVDVVEAHTSPWFFGPYGFVLERAEPLSFRPARGRLGIYGPGLEVTR